MDMDRATSLAFQGFCHGSRPPFSTKLQAGDEFIVVAGVAIERGVNPVPCGVAVRVAARRTEAQLSEQAGSLSGLIGLTVDPDLAVDVVGAAGGADGVGQCG